MGHKSSGTVLGKASSASVCHGYHPVWAVAGLLACAYLRDFVVKGQLLPFHTFIEGEDKADVVSISLRPLPFAHIWNSVDLLFWNDKVLSSWRGLLCRIWRRLPLALSHLL